MRRIILKTLQPIQRSRLDLASLQFRLTLGLTAVFIVGLGSVAFWTNWKMQQILIVTHKQSVDYLADRFPQDVELYSEMLPVEMGLQKTINRFSAPNLLMWVKSPSGKLLAQSSTLNISPTTIKELMLLTEMSIKPQVYQINDRYLVLGGSPLTVKGARLGRLYVAQDVTTDQLMLQQGK